MSEELENIYASMVEAAQRGDVAGALEYVDGMPESQKIELMAYATQWMKIHRVLREELVVHADEASPTANRRAMYQACEMAPSTLYRLLGRREHTTNRWRAAG